MLVYASALPRCALAFSEPRIDNTVSSNDSTRRELLWKLPLGIAGTYVYGRLCYNALSVQGISYPEAHEQRVRSTIQSALLSSARPDSTTLRVLEVGMGDKLRLLRRGLYDDAFARLAASTGVQKVDLVGIDPLSPKEAILLDAQRRPYPLSIDVSFLQGRIDFSLTIPTATLMPLFAA